MNDYILQHQPEFEKSIDFLKKELGSLRTGRAHPSMVENILVDSYGTKTPLQHLASLTTPDPKCIMIQPWDKTIVKNIEKAIIEAKIRINPVNEGQNIRIIIPLLTTEDRLALVKTLNQKHEQAKIKIRMTRDKARESIIEAERSKAITEDQKFEFLKELDDVTKANNDAIKLLCDEKEKDLTTI